MDPDVLYKVTSKPGIKRDGTVLEGEYYTDGQWTRFQRGLPRKIGGIRMMTNDFDGVVRGANLSSKNSLLYLHAGSADLLQRGTFDYTGFGGNVIDRTPAGFVTDDNNLWQMDVIYNSNTSSANLIAHAAPNLLDIGSATETDIYLGDAYGTSALTAISSIQVSGGICTLYPYLFAYGNDGVVNWSVEDEPDDFTNTGSGTARVTGEKIVYGTQTRAGTGVAPAGLFWALDSLVRCSFSGGDAIFNFDQIAAGYSILSSSGVVEYDGVYYWPGVDRFLMYNGVIRELPNDMNLNYFFDNLNFTYRQAVFGVKVPRYGEIWWFYPTMNETEANHVIIYNVREGTWYDTECLRSCGLSSKLFQYPVMFGNELDEDGKIRLWQHEYGTDQIVDTTFNAINSYFTTRDFSLPYSLGSEGPGQDKNITYRRIEPDFVMTGDMTMQFISREYPQSPDVYNTVYNFTGDTTKIDVKEQHRIARLKFQSNQAGGNYECGTPLMLGRVGDGRP